jgi:hypothetical protein
VATSGDFNLAIDSYPAKSVITKAHQFDALLGRSSGEAVKDWREVLSTLRSPRAATALSAFDAEVVT